MLLAVLIVTLLDFLTRNFRRGAATLAAIWAGSRSRVLSLVGAVWCACYTLSLCTDVRDAVSVSPIVLRGSTNKSLVSVDWHPTNRSWIATSAVQDLVFEARVNSSVRATVSHVVIYTFSEFSAQVRDTCC